MPHTGGEEWLSTHQAARRLGVSTPTLYRYVDKGQLMAYRFGRTMRLKSGEVDAYIESCRIMPGELARLFPDLMMVPDDATDL